MAISTIRIENFRNLQAVEQEFDHSFNFIVGDNGSGKTSLLEALFYLGHARSFKISVQNRLINYHQPHFLLFSRIQEHNHHWSVGLQKNRNGNTELRINGEEAKKLADLAKLLPMQVITPEGLNLLNGGPSYKRAFLDWGLFHHQGQFFNSWWQLSRLMKQRNAMLNQTNDYADLAPWDYEIVKLSEQISQWREDYLNAIKPTIKTSCQRFLPEVEISCNFYAGWDRSKNLDNLLQENFVRDKQLGYTLSGAHKADLRLRVENLPVEDILSRGQLKLLMCALRLAQGEYLSAEQQRSCIFLIDDFASELDATKRTLLAERLHLTGAQIFITAINYEQLESMSDTQGKILTMQQGKVIQCPNF